MICYDKTIFIESLLLPLPPLFQMDQIFRKTEHFLGILLTLIYWLTIHFKLLFSNLSRTIDLQHLLSQTSHKVSITIMFCTKHVAQGKLYVIVRKWLAQKWQFWRFTDRRLIIMSFLCCFVQKLRTWTRPDYITRQKVDQKFAISISR